MLADPDDIARTFGADGVLGVGMESSVYTAGPDRIVKVWRSASAAAVEDLRCFYSEIAQALSPVKAPEISEVADVDGRTVTVERRLPGVDGRTYMSQDPTDSSRRAVSLLLPALAAISRVPIPGSIQRLEVFGSRPDPGLAWPAPLLELVTERARCGSAHFRAHVPNWDRALQALLNDLSQIPGRTTSVIHGDLVPENVLVEPTTGELTAVLDFGFLTLAADPCLDAVICAYVCDMYSSEAKRVRSELLAAFSLQFGPGVQEHERAYAASYAAITALAYDDTGTDDHFLWCTGILRQLYGDRGAD